VTFLGIQYASNDSGSGWSPAGLPLVPALTTVAVLTIAAVLFARDWRRIRSRAGSTLVHEAERWLRDQPS
jgi:hypothetical protein